MLSNYFRYLSPTVFDQNWGIYVTTSGYSKVAPFEEYPNGTHPESHHLTWNRGRILNDYYVVFISKGRGTYASALTSPTPVTAGNCFLLYPGVWHRYKPDPKHGWEEYWVGFNGSYISQLLQNTFARNRPVVNLGFNTDMLILFTRLIDEIRLSNVGYPQQIAGITLQILGLVNNAVRNDERADDPVGKLIAKARYLIRESFENSLDMERLASDLPMGYSSFRKAFKQVTGQSPNQYHMEIRMERARNLLLMTLLNINEISDQLGFESVAYFSKLFKKKHGISPMNFRMERGRNLNNGLEDFAV
ncbi:helix-turn-helix transcriptional regulator [Pedobacter ginsengisoli]|uniref:helix-turn-helix transcriptional regulator n=1 Tax=Pedobacter ginsengisoli TaxID=363852 RepID=UPI00254DFAFB|nr:AraC family transcriptional regulator [Pedobacter ginsengisoli]